MGELLPVQQRDHRETLPAGGPRDDLLLGEQQHDPKGHPVLPGKQRGRGNWAG
jgi:hypothetical protein